MTENENVTGCPECGSRELEANTWEAWCYDCGGRWTDAAQPEIFAVLRAAELARRRRIAQELGLT